MTYPFPDDVRNPQRKGPNPFADSDSDSPNENETSTGSSGAGEALDGERLFQSGSPSEYNPVYETSYADRVVTTMISAIIGLAMSLLAWTVFHGYPNNGLLGILSLVFSIAATIIARVDLTGMRAGAVRQHRAKYAAIGMILGLLGLFNSLAILAFGIFYEGWLGII